MENLLEKHFKDLEISLEEIKSATNVFNNENFIGHGGFGNVYKGVLSRNNKQSTFAFKRLNSRLGQGGAEFLKEITMLSQYRHENLISLLGFCNEGHEMILVYEYASRKSLDRHVDKPNLTWTRCLKICVDAAKGLRYLHEDKGTNQRIIHRDIKSANILLDDGWNAKVSDFGLAKYAPTNQEQSYVVTNAVGTPGYCDPQYVNTSTLTKESDVYSFGVVLFEVLCGTLCCKYSNGQVQEIFVTRWKESYEKNKIQEIVFQDLLQDMDHNALKIFSDIAYRCLETSREGRPLMAKVVIELESALKLQEIRDGKKPQVNHQEIIRTAVPPLKYRTEAELMILLSQGVLLNGDKTWFSLDINGEHCEMISIAACLIPTARKSPHYIVSDEYNSRFPVGCYEPLGKTFKTHVQTQFLSPDITYTVNLVFKNKKRNERYIGLEYKLKGETTYSFLADEREDGWLTAELYQFTSNQTSVDLEILFDTQWCETLLIESIEFKPLDKVKHAADDVDMQPISETEKLPDHQDIIMWSKDGTGWTAEKAPYNNFRRISDGDKWFSLTKDGKKYLMMPATAALVNENSDRFKSVADCGLPFYILCKFKSEILSPHTTYATYLVYKLQDKNKYQPPPVQVKEKHSEEPHHIFLLAPQTPVIKWNRIVEIESYNPSNRPKIKGLPRERTDGWMEVQVWEFQTTTTSETIMHLRLSSYDHWPKGGITVRGLEFRPI